MKHFTTSKFWRNFESLPDFIQKMAKRNFELLKANPRHPSLHLKKIKNIWSVRIGLQYRALGTEVEEGILWFWIGTHQDYDRLLASF